MRSLSESVKKHGPILLSLNEFLTKCFLKVTLFSDSRASSMTTVNNSSDYLTEFTRSIIIPSKSLSNYNGIELLREIGEVWLNEFLSSKFVSFRRQIDLESIGNIKLKLSHEWFEEICVIDSFYRDFHLSCPSCSQSIPIYDSSSTIANIFLSHKCIDSVTENRHVCPCGVSFSDHISFVKHIIPLSFDKTGGLTISICPIATFYWLNIATSANSFSVESDRFLCHICDRYLRGHVDSPESLLSSHKFDFFSWMNHIFYDCPQQYDLIETSSQFCVFCSSSPTVSCDKDKILVENNYNLLNSLSTDFNLNFFKLKDFFDFSLDFNLSQKLRPSDFLVQSYLQENLSFSNDELSRMDCLFLNHPYSCSKCLIRFKDISLKYNHSCFTSKGDNCSSTTHVCRCGSLTDNHLSFWDHIFDNCFILTYLYLMLFCLFKKLDVLNCFCNDFYTDSKSLSMFILHWKKCRTAYNVFAKHCRHCFSSQSLLDGNNSSKIIDNETMADLTNFSFIFLENTKSLTLSNNQSPSLSSMSMVANRCQIFSSHLYCDLNTKWSLNNFKYGSVSVIELQEQAALIKPTLHLLENISVKVHKNEYSFGSQSPPVRVQSEVILCQKQKMEFSEENLDYLETSEVAEIADQASPDCLLSTLNYIDYQITPIKIDIKFKKKVFTHTNGLRKIYSSVKGFLNKMKPSLFSSRKQQNIIEYLEEPSDKPKKMNNFIRYYFNKIMRKRKTRNNCKTLSSSAMLPVFRKLACPQNYSNETILWTKNLTVHYLDPYIDSKTANPNSKPGPEIE